MKYSLNYNVSPIYLKKANEIKLPYAKRDKAVALYEQYKVPISIKLGTNPDWKDLSEINVLCQNNLIVGIYLPTQIEEANNAKIKFYYAQPITSYEDFNYLKKVGAAQFILGAPLFFDRETIKDVSVRALPNLAYVGPFTLSDHVHGTWIRPEDINKYNDLIDICEFYANDHNKEEALYRVYAEDKYWKGNLTAIITNLNHNGISAGFPEDLVEKRKTCK